MGVSWTVRQRHSLFTGVTQSVECVPGVADAIVVTEIEKPG